MALYNRSSARRSLIDTVAFRALSQISTIAGYIVLVRAMSEQDFGVLNLLYAFIPVVGLVASLGLEQVLRRYQPEYLRAGAPAMAAWLVRFVASARFASTIVVLGLVLLGWNLFAPLFKIAPYRHEFVLFCVLVVLHFQAGILQLSLGSHMLHRFAVGSTAFLSFVKLLGYGAITVFGSLTLEAAIIADTFAYGVAYLSMFIFHRRHCRPVGPVERPAASERTRLTRYGLYNSFNDAGVLALSQNSDLFYIAAFLDPVSAGIYAFYSRLVAMVANVQPVRIFENIVQPMFFSTHVDAANERVPRYFSFLLNMDLLMLWPVLAFGTIYHHDIVQVVFGGKFGEHSWLLPVFLAILLANSISIPATLVAQYEERAGVILMSKIFAIYNVVALLIVVPLAGLLGAALCSGSSQIFKNCFIWWHVRHRARWLNVGGALGHALLVWGAVIGLCWAARHWVDIHPLLHMILGAVLCGVGVLVHVRSFAISSSDREFLASVLSGSENRLFVWLGLVPRSRTPGVRH